MCQFSGGLGTRFETVFNDMFKIKSMEQSPS
jgi:hypothetical protein